MSSSWRIAALAAAIHLCLPLAFAQSTFGSILGSVQDQSGAVIGSAHVTLRNVDENTSLSKASSSSGEILFVNLKPGHYEIVAERNGFGRALVSGLLLQARQELRVNLQLRVQASNETVEVSAADPEIDTENATIADTKDGELVAELPVNYRGATTSPLAAVVTIPGVQQDSSGNISVNGGFPTAVSYSLDGISTSNVLNGGPNGNMFTSSELISEFKVSGVSNNAEFAQSADITVTTKSGSNNYHGSAFEYLQNAALDATTYGAPIKQTKVGNTFGGSLGGPMTLGHFYDGHDRAFFFADIEANRLPHSTLAQFLLPTAALRGGDLSSLGQTIYNPVTGNPFPNAQITSINSVAKTLLDDYYPVPVGNSLNYPNYSTNKNTPIFTTGYDTRVDYVISPRQQVYVRWSWKSINNTTWPGLGTSYSVSQGMLVPPSDVSEHNRNLVLSHNSTIHSSIQNEFRFGLSLFDSVDKFPLEGREVVDDLGLTGLNLSNHPTSGGFPVFDFSTGTGFQAIGRQKDGPTSDSTYEFSDNLTWVRGHHSFKFGIDAQFVDWKSVEHFAPGDDFGDFYFTGEFTGNSFADFLLGLPNYNFVAVTGPNLNSPSQHFGFYGQDEYRLSQKLTLSYGLRWELHPPFTEKSGNIANFDSKTGSVIVPDHTLALSQDFLTSINACPGTDSAVACIPVVKASTLGLGPGLRATYYSNWDPRIGIAFRPFSDTKTVFRAGFGIFTPSSNGAASYLLSGISTNYFATFANSGSWPPTFQLPQAEPVGQSSDVQFYPGSSEFECAADPHLRDEAIEQWNLTIEHDLGANFVLHTSYIASNAYRLENLVDLNQQKPSKTPFNPLNSPFPAFDKILSSENVAGANFQSWQTQIDHHYKSGGYLQGTYTWSKNLTNAEGTGPTSFPNQWGGTSTDRFNLRNDRGNDYGTRRHRVLLNGIWELPVGKGHWLLADGNRLTQGLFGGWKLSSITLIQTGPFQTPTISCAYDQSNTNPEASMGESCRPDRVGNPNISNPKHNHWYNYNAFTSPPTNAGRDGNAGVGILNGPGTVAVAGGLAKELALSEHTKLRFESSFTNLLNHSNYAPPNVNFSSGELNFGTTDSVQTAENASNRVGQFALRLEF